MCTHSDHQYLDDVTMIVQLPWCLQWATCIVTWYELDLLCNCWPEKLGRGPSCGSDNALTPGELHMHDSVQACGLRRCTMMLSCLFLAALMCRSESSDVIC